MPMCHWFSSQKVLVEEAESKQSHQQTEQVPVPAQPCQKIPIIPVLWTDPSMKTWLAERVCLLQSCGSPLSPMTTYSL